jgi:ubiquinone/menaquinone biosynthesis C-methylase UbiE
MGTTKGYRGIGMEEPIATWYAKNTGRDLSRFKKIAQHITQRVRPGAAILEVAPGPGYLAIELARRGYTVTALDISASFVDIARKNAAAAGVSVDVRHGNASAMPLADDAFDAVVCIAAFKNFTDPLGAINEMHRVLRPGGEAAIFDLRKDASRQAIDAEVRGMHLSAWNSFVTRWTFELLLLKRAYSRDDLERMAGQSRFTQREVALDGIGLELRLRKGQGFVNSR